MFTLVSASVFSAFLLYTLINQFNPDFLTSFTENEEISLSQLQFVIGSVCLSPSLVEKLDSNYSNSTNIGEGEYTKQSIYSILYSLYDQIGTLTSPEGIDYQFTFNTWGIGPTIFPEDDPQQFGKEAYRRLTDFDKVKEYMQLNQVDIERFTFLEVGSGTGAGANLTSHIWPNSHYMALDMQKKPLRHVIKFMLTILLTV
eukprot:UN06791